jgi:hypothetical protein
MHDVEDFAEHMVWLVDESNISDKEKIDLIHNIYQFHNLWDTGFTKLRVYDILIKTGYFRLFDPHEHPDYEKYKNFFDNLSNSNERYKTFIYEDPIAGYSKDAKLTSYWFDYGYDSKTDKDFPLNKMCCEAGSPVWAYFEGEDKAPKDIPIFPLFCRLAELAAENDDIFAKGELYAIMRYVFELKENDEEDAKCIEKMKPILLRDEVMDAVEELYLGNYIGTRKEFEGIEPTPQLMYEWFDYYFDWKKR